MWGHVVARYPGDVGVVMEGVVVEGSDPFRWCGGGVVASGDDASV